MRCNNVLGTRDAHKGYCCSSQRRSRFARARACMLDRPFRRLFLARLCAAVPRWPNRPFDYLLRRFLREFLHPASVAEDRQSQPEFGEPASFERTILKIFSILYLYTPISRGMNCSLNQK